MNAKHIIRVQGACLTDPAGPGGYAATIESPEGESPKGAVNLAGSHPGTNSQRMALAGAIQALTTLNSMSNPEEPALLITSDETLAWALSTGAARNWNNTGWIFPNGTGVTNQDLWFHFLQAAPKSPLNSVLEPDHPELLNLALSHARNARNVGYPAHCVNNPRLQPA